MCLINSNIIETENKEVKRNACYYFLNGHIQKFLKKFKICIDKNNNLWYYNNCR